MKCAISVAIRIVLDRGQSTALGQYYDHNIEGMRDVVVGNWIVERGDIAQEVMDLLFGSFLPEVTFSNEF